MPNGHQTLFLVRGCGLDTRLDRQLCMCYLSGNKTHYLPMCTRAGILSNGLWGICVFISFQFCFFLCYFHLSTSGVPCVQDNGGLTCTRVWQDFSRRQVAGGMDTEMMGPLTHIRITTCLHMDTNHPTLP